MYEWSSALTRKKSEVGLLHRAHVRRGAPAVSHLRFADDIFLFRRAEIKEVRRVKQMLTMYEESETNDAKNRTELWLPDD
ncbi:hypothetical protein LINPERPRIM_LOCUS34074 [Linum perenne]